MVCGQGRLLAHWIWRSSWNTRFSGNIPGSTRCRHQNQGDKTKWGDIRNRNEAYHVNGSAEMATSWFCVEPYTLTDKLATLLGEFRLWKYSINYRSLCTAVPFIIFHIFQFGQGTLSNFHGSYRHPSQLGHLQSMAIAVDARPYSVWIGEMTVLKMS